MFKGILKAFTGLEYRHLRLHREVLEEHLEVAEVASETQEHQEVWSASVDLEQRDLRLHRKVLEHLEVAEVA